MLAQRCLVEHPELEEYAFSDFSAVACRLARERLQDGRATVSMLDVEKKAAILPWERLDLLLCASIEHLHIGIDRILAQMARPGTVFLWGWSNFPTESGSHVHQASSIEYVIDRLRPYAVVQQFELYEGAQWLVHAERNDEGVLV